MTDAEPRFVLNEYGRQCFDLGYEAAKANFQHLLATQAAQREQLQNENARMSEWCDQAGAAMTTHSIEETNQRIRAEAAETQLADQTAQIEQLTKERDEARLMVDERSTPYAMFPSVRDRAVRAETLLAEMAVALRTLISGEEGYGDMRAAMTAARAVIAKMPAAK